MAEAIMKFFSSHEIVKFSEIRANEVEFFVSICERICHFSLFLRDFWLKVLQNVCTRNTICSDLNIAVEGLKNEESNVCIRLISGLF